MVRFKHYRSGALYGIHYHFERSGDGLPEHAHDQSTAHNIIVIEGQVLLAFGSTEWRTISAGEIADFDWSRRHRIIATCPAIIVNMFLHGMPEGYGRLPESETEGVIIP